MHTRLSLDSQKGRIMRLASRATLVATMLALTACSSGASAERNTAFCEASAQWGESLQLLGRQVSALSTVSDGVDDPTDANVVAIMNTIGSDLLDHSESALAYGDTMIANTEDEDVIEAIELINLHTIGIAEAFGDNASQAEDLTTFMEGILEDIELFQGAADFDAESTMTIISDYIMTVCPVV